jgi:hypothetical protein
MGYVCWKKAHTYLDLQRQDKMQKFTMFASAENSALDWTTKIILGVELRGWIQETMEDN